MRADLCAADGAARRGIGGLVTRGSGTLPAGVPAAVVLLLPTTPTPTPACGSPARAHRQDGQRRALLARPLGGPRPPTQDLLMLTGLGEHHQRHDRRRCQTCRGGPGPVTRPALAGRFQCCRSGPASALL